MKFLLIVLFSLKAAALSMTVPSLYTKAKVVEEKNGPHAIKRFILIEQTKIEIDKNLKKLFQTHNLAIDLEEAAPKLTEAGEAVRFSNKLLSLFPGGITKKVKCSKKADGFYCLAFFFSSSSQAFKLSFDGKLKLQD